jgi:superfamily II DNA or RNA helicase
MYSEAITITQPNNVFIRVGCSAGVAQELSEYFSFIAPSAKHDKRYKQRLWDGKIRLFNARTRQVYAGLAELVKEFADKYGYSVADERGLKDSDVPSEAQLKVFLEALNLPEKIEVRDYQLEGLKIAARDKRALLLSPTSSGKSLLIYMICRWFNKRTLIVVPTTTLVKQMAGDFADYGYEKPVSQILAGASKEELAKFTVSTWQSVYSMPPEWLSQFDLVIGDEAHGFKANSLKGIMENMVADVRIGTTGSLDDLKVNELTLQGLFGKIHRLATTRELMDRGLVADLEIKAYELNHSEEIKKAARKAKPEYEDEMNDLIDHPRRNKFIIELTKRLNGNKLVLFKKISHGKMLFEEFKKTHKNVHLVYGDIDTDIRDEIRALTEQSKDAIIVASYRTFGTGINIRNLHHVILAAPIKSKILLIQSIGRSLRLGNEKTKAYVHDIGDNISIGQYQNHTYRHFIGRLELYTKEQFTYKLFRVDI